MLKKIVIGCLIFILLVYIIFLVLPFFLNNVINSYSTKISQIVEDNCGFKVKLENIKILTTPKLTAGIGAKHIDLASPAGETFLTVDNVNTKLSLLPLLIRKVEIDVISADNVNLNLKIKKDGKFLLEDYIPSSDKTVESNKDDSNTSVLPFGIKLSNHLPDIYLNNYNLSFIDMPSDKAYSVFGDRFAVTDFILNKKVKVNLIGKVQFQEKEQFNYDVKILNKVMPDVDLNDLVFNPQTQSQQPKKEVNINFIDIFEALYKNHLTADLKTDIVTYGTFDDMKFDGKLNVSNLKVAVDGKDLPASNIDLNLKGNKINLYTKLLTSEKEVTELVGTLKTGKNPNIDINCKSNAGFKSLIDMVDSIAKSFGCKQLDSLSATGGIDADFNVKSNLKTIQSSGYLKIPSASVNYNNILINNINANIDFSNSIINIKNAGLSIAGQPLKIYGTISNTADINVLADKLQLKGLLLAAGQVALLKENEIKNGTVSVNALIKGKLDKLIPEVKISIDNVNLKNIPSNTLLTMQNTTVNLSSDGKKIDGNAVLKNARIINPALTLSVPQTNLTLGEKDISIYQSYILLNNSRIDISGKIYDYLTQNLKLDILASGNGKIYLKGNINDIYNSQKLDLRILTPENFSIEIPGFSKSLITFRSDFNVTGSALNPYLKGTVTVPQLIIPDMVTMKNLSIALNGPVVKGSGKLEKFISGGIVAENISAGFNLKDNVFYLNDILGDAFDGRILGDISYNLANGIIGVNLKGKIMDAQKAIAGAVGIKNALSGTLNFNADLKLHGATDVEMMKNLKGYANFELKDGTFGNIGRFENLLSAQNLQSNSIIKAAVNSISAVPVIKNTANYTAISGNITFNSGWANIKEIKTTGPSMAYYITGRYNLINSTANLVILGRIAGDVVAILGPLGDLSVSKLTSYIPKFGNLTGNLINALTTDPKSEKVSQIPNLSSKNANYKDFKVLFNGGVESKSSVKSFKWLSKCDMSAIEKVTIKEQIQDTKQAIQEAKQQKLDEFSKRFEEQRKQAQESRQQIIDAKNGLKNLKNMLK